VRGVCGSIVFSIAALAGVPAGAQDAALEALCTGAGGQVKRTEISSAVRTDCTASELAWFRIRSPGTEGQVVVNYRASRAGTWHKAIEAAAADLSVLCGEAKPNLQFDGATLTATCRAARTP
jgi:hypothetical protein